MCLISQSRLTGIYTENVQNSPVAYMSIYAHGEGDVSREFSTAVISNTPLKAVDVLAESITPEVTQDCYSHLETED